MACRRRSANSWAAAASWGSSSRLSGSSASGRSPAAAAAGPATVQGRAVQQAAPTGHFLSSGRSGRPARKPLGPHPRRPGHGPESGMRAAGSAGRDRPRSGPSRTLKAFCRRERRLSDPRPPPADDRSWTFGRELVTESDNLDAPAAGKLPGLLKIVAFPLTVKELRSVIYGT